jgi:hypothetical protein
MVLENSTGLVYDLRGDLESKTWYLEIFGKTVERGGEAVIFTEAQDSKRGSRY